MTKRELMLLILEAAQDISDPENGMPNNKKTADLVMRLVTAAKDLHDGKELLA